jgi:HSP20 family protein
MDRTQLPTLETIVDRFFSNFPLGLDLQLPRMTPALPALDLFELDGKYIVEVAVPGYAPEDIKVEVNGSTLSIYGTYVVKDENTVAKYHHREIRRGSFQRIVNLPQDLDPDAVVAKVEKGLLTITLTPKAPIAVKTIPVHGV